MPEIWERLPNESSKAYAAFCIYRDLGSERSLDGVRRKLEENGKKVSIKFLGRWSSKYNWVARAQAYDDYLERKKREEKEKAILEMAERHARIAVAFQQKIVERLRELDPDQLSPSDLAKWLDVATKLERLSRGEPTEIGKQEVTLPAIVEVIADEENTDTAAPRAEPDMEE